MYCLWPISLHFVYTGFSDTHTQRSDFTWWKPWITCRLLLPLRKRGYPGLTGKVSGMLLPSLPPPERQESFPSIPPGQWEEQLFQHFLLVPAPTLASHLLLPTGRKFEGPSYAQDKAFRPITSLNSGNSLKCWGFSVVLETSWGNSSVRTKATASMLSRKDKIGGHSLKVWFEDMGKRTGQLNTFRSKSEVSPSEDMGVLVVWVSAIDNLIGKEKQMTSSSDGSKTENDILGCSAKIVKFNILRSVKKISSRIKPQNFVRADFILLRELLEGIQEVYFGS